MSDPRAPIFAFLRPHLKGKGWNDKAVREGMDFHLDRLGVPRAATAPAASSGTVTASTTETAASGAGVKPATVKGPLAMIVGTVAAASLFATIPLDEGKSLVAYRDIASIPTICFGDTKNVRMGMVETEEGCRRRLEAQLIAHAKPVMQCSERLSEPGRDWQRAAAVSLAYNIGVRAYCRSTVDRRFDAGNWRGACDAFLMWNKARVGGQLRPVRGLTLRRQREREICLKGLA